MRQANLVKALAEGKAVDTLLKALEKLEIEIKDVSEKLVQAEKECEDSTVKRPTATQVQAVWQDVLRLWTGATEEERVELMGCLVEHVDMNEKGNAACSCLQLQAAFI